MSEPIEIRRRTPAEQIVYAWERLGPQIEESMHGLTPLDPRQTMGLIVAMDQAVAALRTDLAASFTCPACGRTSYNPNDVRERYCGACNGWTGRR